MLELGYFNFSNLGSDSEEKLILKCQGRRVQLVELIGVKKQT